MNNAKVRVTKINIVARHFEETLAFYRQLGVDIPDVLAEPDGVRHVTAARDTGTFAIDNEILARLYNAGWRSGAAQHSLLIVAQVDERTTVDATYEKMVAAGHTPIQPPYDTFWGARFAIVADPEGNAVGIESPSEDKYRWGPPQPSPDL